MKPPPIPDAARRKGPPPIPEAARKEPPPIPEAARKGPPSIPEAALTAQARPELGDYWNQQKLERYAASYEDLSPGVSASFEMRKKRERGEKERGGDCYLADPDTGLFGVLDGLGGGAKVEGQPGLDAQASAMAAHMMPKAYESVRAEIGKDSPSPADVEAYLYDQVMCDPDLLRLAIRAEAGGKDAERFETAKRAAMAEARGQWAALPKEVQAEAVALSRAVKEVNAALPTRLRTQEQQKTGKTTLTAGKIVEVGGKAYAVVVNVGDGAAVKVRRDGSARMMTQEDSLWRYFRDAMRFKDKDGVLKPITPDLPPDTPLFMPNGSPFPDSENGGQLTLKGSKRVVSKAVGQGEAPDAPDYEKFRPRTIVELVRPGEKLVFMTDGAADTLVDDKGETDPGKVGALLAGQKDMSQAAKLVGQASVEAVGPDGKPLKDDDVTIAIVEYNPEVAV